MYLIFGIIYLGIIIALVLAIRAVITCYRSFEKALSNGASKPAR